jgi:hypothetical protein
MRRPAHRKVGTVVGAAAALLSTDDTQELWKRIAEGLGGAIGGNVGARMPDWIEPALHSWHRDVGHSCTTIDAIVKLTPKVIGSWERYCRRKAREAAKKKLAAEAVRQPSWCFLLGEMYWTVATGFLRGLATGYVSHLVLDGATPRGIPLTARRPGDRAAQQPLVKVGRGRWRLADRSALGAQ